MLSEENIKNSFSKVKEDIELIKKELMRQNEELIKLYSALNELKGLVSIGNEGVRQTDRQTDRQTSRQTDRQTDEQPKSVKKPLNLNKTDNNQNPLFKNQTIKQASNQADRQTDEQTDRQTDENIKRATDNLNKLFSSFTKQELKVFLAVYQLEDEGIPPTYENLSSRIELSQSHLRDHINTLLIKNMPLTKSYSKKPIVMFTIDKGFRALNLKNRLINLYYELSKPRKKPIPTED